MSGKQVQVPGDPIWEDGTWSALPPLDGDTTADVCVIGLGGSGLTAVRELQTRGTSVVALDAGQVGGGAAGRNGGFLLAGLAHPHHEMRARIGEQAAVLYRHTLEELDRIEAATPEALARRGSLRIEHTEAGLSDCARQAAAMREDDLTVEDYDGPEGKGLLFPRDGSLQPLRRCRLLAHQAIRDGATLHEATPALDVRRHTVTTARGSVHADTILVLVDGRLEQLLPEVPVRTVRLQMLGTAPLPPRYPRPVYLRGGYEYWQQLPDGRLALGGFRDLGGDEEETTSTDTSPAIQAALDSLLQDIAPGATVTHRWAASVGYTQDALPYLGQVREGVWAAGGYCGTGNVIGALCARQLVSEVFGGPSFWPAT